jgi:hypothetical protein
MTLSPRRRGTRATVAASVCAVVALSGASAGAAAVRPVLSVGADNAVRGSHFRSKELIRIVVSSGVQRVRIVRASAAGSFAAVVPLPTDACTTLVIRATGASGDAAALALSRGWCPAASTSGTQGAGVQPPQTGGLPDQHGPPTVNAGPG